ncbi:IDEAL domain-containing protein [Cohnella faecalis]|uniref:IDEAL domain-containing protein n=1 Tax=Cohnella faecalis TaxID=2315694 RepID=A0A398CYD4_9BACL|nr:IDEAL domain-containing protein [Cohnella faecalis]RIE04004.1 IDEAL domain-containing protein [Cohnella faecalis]
MKFEIGDWVTATSTEDELIQGFIDSIDVVQGTLGVRVIASDHEFAVGKAIIVRNQEAKIMPLSSLDSEEDLMSLIDIALSTKDETWFMELTEKLIALQRGSNSNGQRSRTAAAVRNRLGLAG